MCASLWWKLIFNLQWIIALPGCRGVLIAVAFVHWSPPGSRDKAFGIPCAFEIECSKGCPTTQLIHTLTQNLKSQKWLNDINAWTIISVFCLTAKTNPRYWGPNFNYFILPKNLLTKVFPKRKTKSLCISTRLNSLKITTLYFISSKI